MGIVTLNKKLKPFAIAKARYKVAYGGRGSSKSWTIARILLLKAMENPLRILCVREIQDSIKDSVHKLLKDQIEMLGLSGFEVLNDVIRHANGSEFLFKGLYTNLSKIKSFEGVDVCWIEEAESISAMSWEILDPTIRKPESEIWISFNPRYETDIIYKTFIDEKPDNAIVIKVNHQDNKHFPAELEAQKNRMAKNDPDLYLHIWEGEIKKNTEEQVMQNKWVIEECNPIHGTHFYYGADWGFSADPNTLTKSYIGSHNEFGDNCLFITEEANDRPYSGNKRNTSTDLKNLAGLWDKVSGVRSGVIVADSARPETISYMREDGFNVESVAKWAGSIEDGIEFIRSFDKVIIDPRCVNTIFEFSEYKYKVDKRSGQVTSKILDKNNHMMDALRYSLVAVMKNNIVNYDNLL